MTSVTGNPGWESPSRVDNKHWAARGQRTSVVAVNASIAVNLLIGLAVLALLVYRQLQVRPVRANFRLPLILAVIGVIQLSQFLKHDHHTGTVFAALAGSLALAAIFGAIRAMTVRVWIQAGQALRQGSWITAVLWVVSLGVAPRVRLPGRRQGLTVRPRHGLADPVLRDHLHHPAIHPPGQGPADRRRPASGRRRSRHPRSVLVTVAARNLRGT